MTMVRLRYVKTYTDQHRTVRRYFRRKGCALVALPGEPGSAEFMAAYQAAVAGKAKPKRKPKGSAGSVSAAVASYLASGGFLTLAPDTQRTRRNILDRFRERHGDRGIATLDQAAVQRMVDGKAKTPSMARNFVNTLRALMAFCISAKLRKDDPTQGVVKPRIKTDGYRTWTEDDIEAFEAKHPIGSRARLALALLLYTAQRKSDVVKMGRQHVRSGRIHLRQQKTRVPLAIRIHPELARVLAEVPPGQMTFLMTGQGKPFTAAGFGNWFREVCNEAGLPLGTSAHGLRKAACRRLAQAGCSASEIASISGHATLGEVARYTKAVDQERLADAAMDRVANAKVSHPDRETNSPANPLTQKGGK